MVHFHTDKASCKLFAVPRPLPPLQPDGGSSNARAMWREELLDGIEEVYKGGSALGSLVVYGEMAEPGRLLL